MKYCISVVGKDSASTKQIFIRQLFFDVIEFYCEEFNLKLNGK